TVILFLEAARWLSKAEAVDQRIGAMVIALTLLVCVPQRLMQTRSFVSEHLAQLAGLHLERSPDIVFIRPQNGYYAIDLIQNSPDLTRGPLRLRGAGMEDELAFLRDALHVDAQLVAADSIGSAWRLTTNSGSQ